MIPRAQIPGGDIQETTRLQRVVRILMGVILVALVVCSIAAVSGAALMGFVAALLLVPFLLASFYQKQISKRIARLMREAADLGEREVQNKPVIEQPTHDAMPRR